MGTRTLCGMAWVAVLILVAGGPARADVPRNAPPERDTLQEVLDHIRNHAATGDWQKEGWSDKTIEAWLDKLIAAVAAGAERPELKLPVRLADVKPADPMAIRASGLIVGRTSRRRDCKTRWSWPTGTSKRHCRGIACSWLAAWCRSLAPATA